MQPKPYDVFISYRWVEPDMSWVRSHLYPALQRAELKACLDAIDFIPGRDPIQEMTRAGQESRRALCIITPDYFAGNRLAEFEALSARIRDPAGIDGFLIPFILREVVDLPPWIKNLIPVRWTDPRNHRQEWQKLLTALGATRLNSSPPVSIDEASLVQQPKNFGHVSRPNVQGPADLPELARYNFDSTAFRYLRALGVGNAMQAGNAKRLVDLFCNALSGHTTVERPRRPESWLDAGCGTGLVTMICHEQRHSRKFDWFRECRLRIGIDYAPQMLQIVHLLNEQCYTNIFEADIRYCDQNILKANSSVSRVDLIFANNVFHWLFDEEQIQLAFCNCYDILDKNGGCLAASIAATGTGRLFRGVYAEECSRLLDRDERDKWKRHIENPIGLQRLDSIVRIAKESNFKIAVAHLEYEPIDFESTDAYVEAARGYGEEVFMAPLLSLSTESREEFWDRLKRSLREKYATGSQKDAKYVHDQFMIYILAIRRD